MSIRRTIALAGALALTASLTAVGTASASTATSSRHGPSVMTSTVAGSLPTDPVLFGVAPGGLPWEVDRGTVRLSEHRLDVRLTGFVVPDTGTNPVPGLSASVVCGGAVVAGTATVTFPADGDVRIRSSIDLPERCLAPVVLLHPNGNPAVYIGVSGSE